MKKLRDFINPKISSDQSDIIMEKLLNQKFQGEKRSRYESLLKENYGISRQDSEKNQVSKKSNSLVLKMLAFLIFLGALAGAWFALNKTAESTPEPQNQSEMIFAYMDNNPVAMYDNTRGEGDDASEARTQARNEFGASNYQAALDNYSKIDLLTAEDYYYKSYSLLKLKNFQEARIGFKQCNDQLKEGEQYYAESNLYLILSYLGEGNTTEAKSRYDKLEAASWERKQLKGFFK